MGSTLAQALRDVTLDIAAGEFFAIMRPSSSQIHLHESARLPRSQSWSLSVNEVSQLSSDELAHVRNRQIGFVFQHFNLLARTSALDNVALPLLYSQLPVAERDARAKRRLPQVGLATRGSPPCAAFRWPAAAHGHCTSAGL